MVAVSSGLRRQVARSWRSANVSKVQITTCGSIEMMISILDIFHDTLRGVARFKKLIGHDVTVHDILILTNSDAGYARGGRLPGLALLNSVTHACAASRP